MKYILGLDVGIGSVGWAVVRDDEEIKRIEDFGVRVFDSGEILDRKKQKRSSQKRREFRAQRRLVRRKSHRKFRLKAYLDKIGFVKDAEIKEYYETTNLDIISVRARAIDEQITPAELAACLIHICNHRGYREFYEQDMDEMSADEKKELAKEQSGINLVREKMKKYRTVAEMIKKDDYFKNSSSEFRCYRNSDFRNEKLLFPRELLEKEVSLILEKQREFYKSLTDNNIAIIKDIVFSQRDFEDGPGNPEDSSRKYTGFLDTLGKCTYYKDEKRGNRFTILADIFSLVDVLSQQNYYNEETGESRLPKEAAEQLINDSIANGKVNATSINKILKKYGIKTHSKIDAKEIKCLKFIPSVRQNFIDAGYDWCEIASGYADENSLLNKIGIVLSENITPKRRKAALERAFPDLDKTLLENLTKKQVKGTTNVCYRYMRDIINAFLNGDSYGTAQALIKKEIPENDGNNKRYKKLPAFDKDCEFYDSPVVMRSINETRKIINAVVEKYGSPYAINIEVASELNKSFEMRAKEQKKQTDNEKINDNALKACREILGRDDVTPAEIERYKLGEQQNWQCLYSGKNLYPGEPIDKKIAIENKDKIFEVDHIIPFSLILDNTLNNKALVYAGENQTKGQNAPLMYLDGERASEFKKKVNFCFGGKKEFKKKYRYLMCENLPSELIKEWKSRNINDTRYISKYLVNYLSSNLEFSSDENSEKDGRKKVYAVKGAITSKMRRQWLDKDTWGIPDKAELKRETLLDHAADAIVIANCIPAYVEMAALNLRLRDIYYSNGKTESEEYKRVYSKARESLNKFYGLPFSDIDKELGKKKNTPSLIPNLRDEVNIRLWDKDMEYFFEKRKTENRKNEHPETGNLYPDPVKKSEEESFNEFRTAVDNFYRYDSEFAKKVHLPIVSMKPDREINKNLLSLENPISLKTIDGVDYKISSIKVKDITKKLIPDIYTNDSKLIATLEALFEGKDDTATLEKVLKEKGECEFIYNGRKVNKLKVKSVYKLHYMKKQISENNYAILEDRHYYCLEVYENNKGDTCVNGITYSDLIVSGGKLYLRSDYKYPADYEMFKMYIYPKDYLQITKADEIIEGYYRGIKNVKENKVLIAKRNQDESVVTYIAKKDTIKKIDIDILGNMGGVIKCGEPLSLIPEKN